MTDEADPLAQYGLDAIDLRWTLKDIASKRTWLINQDHLATRHARHWRGLQTAMV